MFGVEVYINPSRQLNDGPNHIHINKDLHAWAISDTVYADFGKLEPSSAKNETTTMFFSANILASLYI